MAKVYVAGLCCFNKTKIERTSENFEWSGFWYGGGLEVYKDFAPQIGSNESEATLYSYHSYPMSYASEVMLVSLGNDSEAA